MTKKTHLGLFLLALPSYSETFLTNKINGLLESGFKISLFVTNYNKSRENTFDNSVEIYYQINTKNRLKAAYTFIQTIIMRPINVFKFIGFERKIKRSYYQVIKNIIINSNVFLKNDIDWLHFEFATLGINRENIGKSINAKVACSFRGYDITLFPHKNVGCYNILFKVLDKLHTISDDLYVEGRKLGLKKETDVMKITPAINTKFFKAQYSSNKINNPLRILTVGRLTWKKGYDYALDALKVLKDSGFSFEYRIIGDGEYYNEIFYSSHMLDISKNIKFLKSVSKEDLLEEMKWADIYLQPSIQEGFCNAVIEAQAMGLVVIATNADGLSENVINNKTGWIVPKRDSEAIVAKILHVLSLSNDELNVIKKNARERVERTFNLSKQKKLFFKFYEPQ